MKKLTALILVFVMVLSMTACGTADGDDKFYNENDPIQIIDGAGRKVSFQEPVKTSATSWGGTCDPFLFALQLQDCMVATNSKSDLHKLYFSDIESFPNVGRWTLDKEALAELSPDLYIHSASAVNHLNDANKVGVRSIGLKLNKMEDIADSVLILGTAFGVEERANFVNQKCSEILDLVSSRTQSLIEADKSTVVVLGGAIGEIGSTACNAIEQMIALAGGISVAPEDVTSQSSFTNVGLETIFKWNADYIFLQDYFCELTVEDIMNDANWSNLNAVQNAHVYAVPCALDSWTNATPAACLGVLYISMTLYPELYEDVDLESVARQFYKEVYDLDLSAEELGIAK